MGYVSGTVGSAGASANVDTAMATFGGRYGAFSLDSGPYLAARVNVGHVDYQSTRTLGGGLGIAQGRSSGALYNGRIDLGNVIRMAPFTVTPQVGLRVGEVNLRGFNESGSELALSVNRLSNSSSSVHADLDLSLDPHKFADWTVTPTVAVGSEFALGNPKVESVGTLYGYSVIQSAAYDSRFLMKAGLAVAAQRGAFVVKGGISAMHGDQASAGLSAQVSVGYSF
jgi:outer membrane autotransporter protein